MDILKSIYSPNKKEPKESFACSIHGQFVGFFIRKTRSDVQKWVNKQKYAECVPLDKKRQTDVSDFHWIIDE